MLNHYDDANEEMNQMNSARKNNSKKPNAKLADDPVDPPSPR